MMSPFRKIALAASVAGVLLSATVAGAQEASCTLAEKPSNTVVRYRLPSGDANIFIGGGGVTMRCPSRGITLVADSIEQYGDERRIFLLGRVSYREPRLSLSSNYLTYFLADERIVASGNVVATLPSGSTLRGPQAEYRRAVARVRDVSELHSIGRPTVSIVQRQTGARAANAGRSGAGDGPTTVTANVLYVRGDSLLYASGQVDIVRTDFGARGDSVFMNTSTEYMRLMRDPAIEGRTGRPFTLKGTLIDLFSRDRQLDRVLAQGEANAISDGMTLASDTIEFRVADDLLQAASAWGTTRQAEAVAQAQRITADSINVRMPEQRVQAMHALGNAHAEASPDSTRFITAEKDWLRGDTIVALFDTVRASPSDSSQSEIRELIAFVGARSYQHMPPRDTTLRCPAISYVRGDSLRARFEGGQVRTVDVVKGAEISGGIIAEPDSTCRPAAEAGERAAPPGPEVRPGRPAGSPAPTPPALPAPASASPVQAPRGSTTPPSADARPQSTSP